MQLYDETLKENILILWKEYYAILYAKEINWNVVPEVLLGQWSIQRAATNNYHD